MDQQNRTGGSATFGRGEKGGFAGGGGWVGSNVLKSRLLQPPVAKAWWSPNSRTDPVGGSRASRASGGGGGLRGDESLPCVQTNLCGGVTVLVGGVVVCLAGHAHLSRLNLCQWSIIGVDIHSVNGVVMLVGGGGWGDGCWAAVAGLLRHCGCRVGRPSLLCRGGPGEAGRPLLDCVSAAAGRQTQLGGAGASAGVWVFWGGGWAAVAGLSHCSCLWQNLAVLHQQNVRVVLFTHPGAAGGSSFVVHGLHGSTREC
jgi:hypothetical protein